MTDQKNTILAIVLSAIVLIAWQYFVGMPQMDKQRQEAQLKAQQQQQAQQIPAPQPGAPATQPGAPAQPGAVPAPQAGAPPVPGQTPGVPRQAVTREAVIAASPRIAIETPKLGGSVSLRGGRLDDLTLTQYRETVDPKSPPIVLLSPSSSPHPFYAQFGWTTGPGQTLKLPDDTTVWRQQGSGTLGVGRPVTLTYDNGEGLEFRRVISVDDKYMFTVDDQVINKSASPISLNPYGLISRHGTPKIEGFFILHEGLIGVMGDKGLEEVTYSTIEDKKAINYKTTNAWFGITDKYWAATLIPDPKAALNIRFSSGALGTRRPTRPTISVTRKPSRPARPQHTSRGCSRAPRKSRWSTATTRSSSSTDSSC